MIVFCIGILVGMALGALVTLGALFYVLTNHELRA